MTTAQPQGQGKAGEQPKGITASGNKQGQDSVQVQESGSGRREVEQLCSASTRGAGEPGLACS